MFPTVFAFVKQAITNIMPREDIGRPLIFAWIHAPVPVPVPVLGSRTAQKLPQMTSPSFSGSPAVLI